MKAILEFDFDNEDIDDRAEFAAAMSGTKFQAFAWQFDQWLRSSTKYAPDFQDENYTKALYDARDKFHEMLHESNLKLD